jgi:hypothetical protein
MQIPLKPSESSPGSSNPGNASSDCDALHIAQEAVSLRERKMEIMAQLLEKVEAHEVRAEERINRWLDKAQQWQKGLE